MKKGFITAFIILGFFSCFLVKTAFCGNVTLTNKGNYWEVVMDYTGDSTYYEMGKKYGQALLEKIPDFHVGIDSYLAKILPQFYADICIKRFPSVEIPKEYLEELNGICDAFGVIDTNKLGDGKLSRDEFLLNNYISDVSSMTECSGIAVWGNRSKDGTTIVGRNLDLHTSNRSGTAKNNAVITVKNGKKSYCTIGYLGFMPVLTAFKPNGLYVAVFDSGLTRPKALPDDPGNPVIVAADYKKVVPSWVYSVRYSIENFSTIEEVARYMTSHDYHWNHNILVADSERAVVIENNISGPAGWQGKQLVRDEKTELNYGVEPWKIDNSIGVVNSFVAKGNYDNHTNALRNVRRRHNQIKLLAQKGDKVTFDDVVAIQSWYKGKKPDSIFLGDLFNYDWRIYTAQSIVFCPKTLKLKAFFDNLEQPDGLPVKPNYDEIEVSF